MNNSLEHALLGTWLKGKREAAGLSQTQVAGLIGRHKSFVGRYEAGSRLEILEFVTIALALKADPREGLGLVMQSQLS
jgi:transcriptional regulator with XRE-family HTH domain